MAVGTSVEVAVVVKSSTIIDEDNADDDDAVSCCVRGRDGANAWHGLVDHESMAAKTAAATVFFMLIKGMYVLVIILNYD